MTSKWAARAATVSSARPRRLTRHPVPTRQAGDTAASYTGRDYDYAERDKDATAEWAPPGYSSQGYR